MAREINRKRLTRLFELPDGAADAEIVEKIRLFCGRFDGCARTFVLPDELDLRSCLYALWDCMWDDREFSEAADSQLDVEIERLKAANNERLHRIHSRYSMLELIIESARNQTEWEDPSVITARRKEQVLAKKEAARERQRQKKAAEAAGRT
ncbi:hypothetical protein MKK63_25145 [Methylobacterium sp. J-088]|uniref:hypothetical protein n=1 Tax=Methylobacterium sp. J-088 TaxID=2836664 RepID=UPI001FBB9B6B|nr:hypothetical protein [Methylobacterium sp. J-088]MCJ2065968.1 hypothetical protein [Methylobacterium sp. J-088]